MAYSGQTTFYRLPFMRTNDYLTEAEEERRAKIIDHLLYVATYGASKAIIEDGEYELIEDATSAGSYTLSITSSGTSFVIMAIVNFRLAYRQESITVQLQSEKMNYVYLFAVDDMDVDPARCQIVLSETPINDIRHLLLATVDCTGSLPLLDIDTDKQYLTNLAAHSMDSTNPHGTTLSQAILRVLNTFSIKDHEVHPYVYYEIPSSTGTTPTNVQIEGLTPLFVTAMVDDVTTGTVACQINEKTISVTNSGATGKKIILKVEGVFE